jgi:FK506-binding nuclear protein
MTVAQYRITMAALDPTEAPEADEEGNIPDKPRATLKLVRQRYSDLDDELDDEYLDALMGGSDDDDEDSEDEEVNGGPSDPAKSKKAKAEAALQKLIEAAQAEEDEDSDDEMADTDAKLNGAKPTKKGKEPATSSDDDDDDSVGSDGLDLEEFVICTLDTERVSSICIVVALRLLTWASRTTSNLLTSLLALTRRSSSV